MEERMQVQKGKMRRKRRRNGKKNATGRWSFFFLGLADVFRRGKEFSTSFFFSEILLQHSGAFVSERPKKYGFKLGLQTRLMGLNRGEIHSLG